MTDASENETQTTSETQERTRLYTVGESITIMRGLLANKQGKILGVDASDANPANAKYAVNLTDGSFAVVNHKNVKPPVEGQIGASYLADIVHRVNGDPDALVESLSRNVDGFGKAYDALSASE